MAGFQRSAQVFFVLTVASSALLLGTQGCSSSGDSSEEDAAAPPFGSSGTSSGGSNSSSSSSSSSSTSSSGGTDAGRDGATNEGGTGTCLNDTVNGAAPQCPANQCNNSCQTINNNFKKGVAADAIKNLTQQICQGNTVNAPVTASVAKACADPTAKAFCDALVAGGCGGQFPMFPTQCANLTNALSGTGVGGQATGGRKAFRDCLNNPNNGLDCTSCQEFVKGRR